MRDHESLLIPKNYGLYKRGDADTCPPDHMTECRNIQFNSVDIARTRDGLDTYVAVPNVLRIFTVTTELGEGLLILDTDGNIWHTILLTIYGPILSIAGMTDFSCVEFNRRVYISPGVKNSLMGMENEVIYVYKGNGSVARPAGGAIPVNGGSPFTATESADNGFVEAGWHIFAVAYETDTGYITGLGPLDLFPSVNAQGGKEVDLTNIPISPDITTVARRIVATRAIDPDTYTGNTEGYQFFFIPGARIEDNTTTDLTVSFFDADLLADASYLFDLFTTIPASGGLGKYHNRLLSWCEYGDDMSIVRVSAAGEPEAINEIDGLLVLDRNFRGITRCQEFRDVLYVFKINQTVAYNDNGDVPSSWPQTIIDQGIGCAKNGVATVSSSGGVNIDFLIIMNYSEIILFNGSYIRPELTWKIQDFWQSGSRDHIIYNAQIYNEAQGKVLYISLPSYGQILIGDYGEGLTAKTIKWAPWTFDIEPTSISIIEIDKVLVGSRQAWVITANEVPESPSDLDVLSLG